MELLVRGDTSSHKVIAVGLQRSVMTMMIFSGTRDDE